MALVYALFAALFVSGAFGWRLWRTVVEIQQTADSSFYRPLVEWGWLLAGVALAAGSESMGVPFNLTMTGVFAVALIGIVRRLRDQP